MRSQQNCPKSQLNQKNYQAQKPDKTKNIKKKNMNKCVLGRIYIYTYTIKTITEGGWERGEEEEEEEREREREREREIQRTW